LQVVSSDHFLIKAVDRNSKMGVTIEDLQCGQAGVELRLPVLYTLGVACGRLSLERFVDLVATNPAKLMGLYPRKGALRVGADADVCVLDQEARWQVTLPELHMDSDYNCWEGWELAARVRTVVRRGEVMVEDGRLVGSTTGGRFLERSIPGDVVRQPMDSSLTGAHAAPTAVT
jgi:dihydropyrimidinase